MDGSVFSESLTEVLETELEDYLFDELLKGAVYKRWVAHVELVQHATLRVVLCMSVFV